MRTVVEQNDGNYYVYLYLNPLNDMRPFYVGRGKGSRAFQHLTERNARNRHKAATIAKIRRETGCDPPIVIHCDGLSYADSCRVEIEMIAEYGRADLGAGPLTNMIAGGDGILSLSVDARQRMSLAKGSVTARPEPLPSLLLSPGALSSAVEEDLMSSRQPEQDVPMPDGPPTALVAVSLPARTWLRVLDAVNREGHRLVRRGRESADRGYAPDHAGLAMLSDASAAVGRAADAPESRRFVFVVE